MQMPESFGHQGAYRVVSEIGRGGFATVYKAYQASLDRHVAIKVLRPEVVQDSTGVERFQREARAAARLGGHPNIVTIYDYGEQDGMAYLVLEFIDGGTLQDRLTRSISAGDIERIVTGVASALEYAHANQLVHRDVKPSNVLIGNDGRVVLSDFGIAKLLDAATSLTGAAIGTPEYMAPEQITGAAVDARSDIYALGVMVYRIFSGRPPFQGNMMSVLHRHVHEPPPPMAEGGRPIPPDVERVVLRALAKDPADRYSSATELATNLAEALQPAILRERARAALGRGELDRAERLAIELLAGNPSDEAARYVRHEVLRQRQLVQARTAVERLLDAGDWQSALGEIDRLRLRESGDAAALELARRADEARATEAARIEEERRRAEAARREEERRRAEQERLQREARERAEREARARAERERQEREARERTEQEASSEQERLEREERERQARDARARAEWEAREQAERARIAREARDRVAREADQRERQETIAAPFAEEMATRVGLPDSREPGDRPLEVEPLTVGATVEPSRVPPRPATPAASPVGGTRGLWLGLAALVVLVGAGALLWPSLFGGNPSPSPTPTAAVVAQPSKPTLAPTNLPTAAPVAEPATPAPQQAPSTPAVTPESKPTAPVQPKPESKPPEPKPAEPKPGEPTAAPPVVAELPPRITLQDGATMAIVPAGAFTMGSEADQSASPSHKLELPAFYVDLAEVTNARFAWFTEQAGYQAQGNWRRYFDPQFIDATHYDADRKEHPVVNVTWADADAYCRWAGKRLPTEAEWEKAARGGDGRRWPWGNDPHPEYANVETGDETGREPDTMRVGSFPRGASPYGALDMAGNVWEWTASPLLPYPLDPGSLFALAPNATTPRVTRGASWLSLPERMEVTSRVAEPPSRTSKDLGFRCAVAANETERR
jgi:formylglycine-generating enzyme required for sulfatase activity